MISLFIYLDFVVEISRPTFQPITRQFLRLALLEPLGGEAAVQWDYRA
ncbi:MAG: hypothetical protein HRU20_13105 [Pseudomonadales bacterium]|nr:hypothetical protein [Pseudomonadales bacterium]